MSDKGCAVVLNLSAFAWMCVPPYSVLYVPIVNIFFYLLPLCIPLLNKKKICIGNFREALLYFLVWGGIYAISFVFNSHMPETSYLLYTLYGTVFLLMSDSVKRLTFNIFVKVYAVILSLGIIEYVLFLQGLYIPIGITTRENAAANYDLIQCLFSFISLYSDDYVRFQSLANEPGLIGTLCALLLFVMDRKEHKIAFFVFVIAGILTLSLAFYILFLLYILFQMRSKRNVLVAVACLVILYMAYNIFKDTASVELVTERIESGQDADNRTSDQFEQHLNQMMSSSRIWFGMGYGAIEDLYISDGGNSGAKVCFYHIGIFGIILLFVMYTYLILKKKGVNYISFCFLVAFWMSFYQRDTISVPYNVIVFFSPLMANMIEKTKLKRRIAYENITNHTTVRAGRS